MSGSKTVHVESKRDKMHTPEGNLVTHQLLSDNDLAFYHPFYFYICIQISQNDWHTEEEVFAHILDVLKYCQLPLEANHHQTNNL